MELQSEKFDTYPILYHSTMLLFSVLNGGIEVIGAENVPREGPVLMVANHISYLDPCVIGDASPRRVIFMGKVELFKMPVVGWLLRGVDGIPVKRGEADTSAFRTTLARLKEGRLVCIFPEGTRSPDGTMQPAEGGAGLFATRTGCPVVPVYIRGTDKMLDRKGRFHRARVTMTMGEPFYLPKTMDRDAAAQILMEKIAEIRDLPAELQGERQILRLSSLRKPH